MEHLYIDKTNKGPVFILLHGTGGDEHSLVELAQGVYPNASVLALRGQVNEAGMLRFFARKGHGHYDLEDLAYRSKEIISFLKQAIQSYHLEGRKLYLMGFSNGSNMGIQLMRDADDLFLGAILMAPMFPVEVETWHDWSKHKIFLSFGRRDPLCSLADSEHVEKIFLNNQAKPHIYWVNGHEVTLDLLNHLRDWCQQNIN